MNYCKLTACWIMILLITMVGLVSYPFRTVFSQTTAVAVEPEAVSAHIGQPFIVTVRLSNVQNLYGLEVILNWNPDVMRVANVDIRLGVETYSDGVLHELDSSPPLLIAEDNLTQAKGEYRLVATSMNPAPPFNGSGNIVRITFDPLQIGESVLDLESQLSDYPPLDRDPPISFLIDHATIDSTVTVYESTSTPTPTSPTTSPTSTPTQTLTPTPTSSSSPEPPVLDLKIEHVLAILAIIIVIVLTYLFLRSRKQ